MYVLLLILCVGERRAVCLFLLDTNKYTSYVCIINNYFCPGNKPQKKYSVYIYKLCSFVVVSEPQEEEENNTFFQEGRKKRVLSCTHALLFTTE